MPKEGISKREEYFLMGKLFGTDGVRGVANSELTPELAFRLGRAAGTLLKNRSREPR